MILVVHGATTAGRRHQEAGLPSQDCWVADADTGIIAVADGLGSPAVRHDASQLALHALLAAMRGGGVNLDQAMQDVAEALERHLLQGRIPPRAGTTLTALHLENDQCRFAHVGDTRLYHRSADGFRQVTRDHTLAADLRGGGWRAPRRSQHLLLQALGASPMVCPQSGLLGLASGDRLLLCSDGVWEVLSPTRLRGLLAASLDAVALVEAAWRQGATDDLTAVTCEVRRTGVELDLLVTGQEFRAPG